ncbi:hypothetical protein SKAU_G00311480 [Synaphobranchus kaupii]|uniref:Uncharacterized protein n=1 Tax=Synaphobranchus kaupii TaxID=118154 RepID=A0A9Q1ERQ6_SYNKA|nr:hypothetical protein SKAU_G00311480 [Synaphobranchus kaupii]
MVLPQDHAVWAGVKSWGPRGRGGGAMHWKPQVSGGGALGGSPRTGLPLILSPSWSSAGKAYCYCKAPQHKLNTLQALFILFGPARQLVPLRSQKNSHTGTRDQRRQPPSPGSRFLKIFTRGERLCHWGRGGFQRNAGGQGQQAGLGRAARRAGAVRRTRIRRGGEETK